MIKNQKTNLIIRVGLAAVFLANAYTAFFSPGEFVELIEGTFLGNVLSENLISLFPKLIGVSDGLVALFLISAVKVKLVSFYAAAWILGVTLVTFFQGPAETLEHLGILSMAIYLFIES